MPDHPSKPSVSPSPETFPAGLHNAFFFGGFNALSFQMILGSPMILYAKSLDASATVLGIISGMMPLLVIFQIPAASHIARLGYKRFVYGGWGIRVIFIFFLVLVPVAEPFLSRATRIALLLFLLFGFNLSRGISSCAWLPWITSLVPASLRGRYLTQEAGFVNLASFLAFVLAAVCLGAHPVAWQFSVVFLFSAIMGVVSLSFLKRIPDADLPEQVRVSSEPVPWLEIARFPPFRKLLRMNLGWSVAYGGISAFTVAFLKTETAMPEDRILYVTAVAFLGGFSSLWFLGSRMDRFGSKPIFAVSIWAWIFIIGAWLLLAGRVLPAVWWVVLPLQLLMGLGAAAVNMANTRLAMVIIPPMGRTHFFAIFSVVANLSLGAAPIFWGLLIDLFRPLDATWQGLVWNRYTVFFLLVLIAFGVTLWLCRQLEEPEAAGLDDLLKELLIESPQRFWLRFWPRN